MINKIQAYFKIVDFLKKEKNHLSNVENDISIIDEGDYLTTSLAAKRLKIV